jgi:hypothetical protein
MTLFGSFPTSFPLERKEYHSSLCTSAKSSPLVYCTNGLFYSEAIAQLTDHQNA